MARSLIVPGKVRLGAARRGRAPNAEVERRGHRRAAGVLRRGRRRLRRAKRRFDAFRAGDDAALPSEYQSAVYKLVLARGGRETFDQLLGYARRGR